MPSSAFIVQLLPLHIVESIIDYARATSAYNYTYNRHTSSSIIHCCQSWRFVFLKRACSSISFRFDHCDTPRFVFTEFPGVISPLSHPVSQHVRRLFIYTTSWDYVIDGSLLTWMGKTGILDLSFPLAESLIIKVSHGLNVYPSTDESINAAVKNLQTFMQHIRSMVPNIKSADIEWYSFLSFRANQDGVSSSNIPLSKILQGLRKFRFVQTGKESLVRYDPIYTSELTHLDLTFSFNPTWFIELVHRNADTLESFKSSHMYSSDFKSLLHKSDTEPIVYPLLKLLKFDRIFHISSGLAMPDNSTFESTNNGTNHFPSLESFYICGEIPFIDGVFMPGKNLTLKHLSILFFSSSFEENNTVLQNYAPTQFCNLSSIRVNGVSVTSQPEDDILINQIEFLRLALSHSTNVQKLEYSGYMDKCRFFQEAQSTFIFQSLRVLNIRDIILSFSDIVLLLQNTPLLQSLKSSIDNKAPKIKGVGPSKLPGYISSMQPLGIWLRRITLLMETRRPIEYIAKVAILLAIGCPRLSIFMCSKFSADDVCNKITSISETKPFNDYVEQCRFISSKIYYFSDTMESV